MRKRLNISVAEDVYDGLYREVGPRRISAFIEHLVRPYVIPEALDQAYADMAAAERREREALATAKGLAAGVADDPR